MESTRLGCLSMLHTNLLFSLVYDLRLFTQSRVYFGLSPCVGQSAGTALDVKVWRGESYSLLTKSPLHIFTSKLEEWEFDQHRGFICGLCFKTSTSRGLYGLCFKTSTSRGLYGLCFKPQQIDFSVYVDYSYSSLSRCAGRRLGLPPMFWRCRRQRRWWYPWSREEDCMRCNSRRWEPLADWWRWRGRGQE